MFEIALATDDPSSQEDHLEFHWLPLADLADTDVRPTTLKNALLGTSGELISIWRGWNG